MPAVVYGLGEESVSVTVSSRELAHILSGAAGANTLITLEHRRQHRSSRSPGRSSATR